MLNIENKKESVREKSLKWILGNLHNFDVVHSNHDDIRQNLKSFVELIFVINPIIRKGYSNPKLDRVIKFISDSIEDYDFESAIHYDLEGLAGIAIIDEFNILSKNKSFYNLSNYYDFDILNRLERTPFRKMDLKYSLERVGAKENLGSYQEIYKQCIPGKDAPIYTLSIMEMYSLTHVVFYLSDMGNRNVNLILNDEELTQLKLKVIKSLAFLVKHKNIDLIGELLLCSKFLKLYENDVLYELAWSIIIENQDKKGFVPPIVDSNSKTSKKRKKINEFERNYHSTLVVLGASTL